MNSVGDVPYPSCGVLFLTPLQPEPVPTVDMIDFVEAPRTPTTNNINIADAYDWQHHANIAEHELSIERTKLQREKRKTHRFQAQINEYIEVLYRGLQTGEEPMSVSVEYKLGPLSQSWKAEASSTDFGGG